MGGTRGRYNSTECPLNFCLFRKEICCVNQLYSTFCSVTARYSSLYRNSSLTVTKYRDYILKLRSVPMLLGHSTRQISEGPKTIAFTRP